MAVRSDTPTGKRRQAVELMVQGHTQEEIARRLNVGRMTLYRWRRQPEFARALAEAEDDAWRAQLRTLARAAGAGMAYLITVMGNATAPTELRVRAASTLMARWTALQPHRVEAAVAVTPAPAEQPREPLDEMLARIADNWAATEPRQLSGVARNGSRGNGNGSGS